MLCYMDKTFCIHAETCTYARNCHRAWTPELQKAADEWWKGCEGNAPVCVFMDKPKCHSDND